MEAHVIASSSKGTELIPPRSDYVLVSGCLSLGVEYHSRVVCICTDQNCSHHGQTGVRNADEK
jgi:hypothetical protein